MKYLAKSIYLFANTYYKTCYSFKDLMVCGMNEYSPNLGFEQYELVENIQTQSCQYSIPWHLERIQERGPVYRKVAGTQSGKGLAYILDTWIDIDHQELEGRVFRGPAFASDFQKTQGHGTFIAGLIGSKTFGVAKNSIMIGIQVMNGDGVGDTYKLIQGLNWVFQNWTAYGKPRAVINLSLAGPYSNLLNQVVEKIHQAGLPVIVASGNSAVNASDISPASAQIITVAASDQQDGWGSFSNYGPCVNIIAPGVGVQSLWPNQLQAVMSGTSMATAIVSGSILAGSSVNDATKNSILNVPKNTINLFTYIKPQIICSPLHFLVQNSNRPS
jgi:hypothetical protein